MYGDDLPNKVRIQIDDRSCFRLKWGNFLVEPDDHINEEEEDYSKNKKAMQIL